MKNPKLANRYAKALFDFAKEKDQIEVVNKDLAQVRNILKENTELQSVLNSPVIAPSKKHVIFANVFQSALSEISFSFLDVIIRKKREPMLGTICEEFTKYYNEYHKIKVVTLTSAQALSSDLVDKIRNMLAEQTHYTIEINQLLNPEIIGGIQVKMDDFYFDASISSKINKLKQEFAHNIYQVNF
ncbi:MAG: ATP synthase F1 subunit delta [Bacteroidales bacterium]|nr:ATP synthase F1 subunit delta [Bacteroidales bacterium]